MGITCESQDNVVVDSLCTLDGDDNDDDDDDA